MGFKEEVARPQDLRGFISPPRGPLQDPKLLINFKKEVGKPQDLKSFISPPKGALQDPKQPVNFNYANQYPQ